MIQGFFTTLHCVLSLREGNIVNYYLVTVDIHNYLKQHNCPDPPMEDQNDPDMPMPVAENNQ